MTKQILFLLFIFYSFIYSQDVQEYFKEGNDYFKKKNYEEAINSYEKIVKSGFENEAVYFNLGNSYYRSGKIGKSILFYEKALKFSPSDEDIKHNLKVANAKTMDKLEALPKFFLFEFMELLLSLFSLEGWIKFGYVIFLSLLVTYSIFLFAKKTNIQRMALFISFPLIFIFIMNIAFAVFKFNFEENRKYGVAIEQNVNVKSSPDVNSSELFIIHEGLKFRIEDKVDNWYKIKLEDGKVGWLNEKSFEII